MKTRPLTSSYLLQNADKLPVALSMNLSKVDVLEVTFLRLSASAHLYLDRLHSLPKP
jgi:hypothetical protein